jgi:tRNA (pseudouridine54-N1)-methyltransferase
MTVLGQRSDGPGITRRFVVVCSRATASGEFLLDDLPGTSGRLDVGLRCIRAALLFSHGLRRDAVVYLVLRGGPRAPRVLRITGREARFLRPDERSLAVLVQKALACGDDESSGFVDVRPGVAVARGDVEHVLTDLGAATPYVLEKGAPDLRDAKGLGGADVAFVLGDHVGLDEATRSRLTAIGAQPLGVGPVAVHAEDAITIVSNELDRRESDSA